MKTKLSKQQAQQKIEEFFQKHSLTSEEVKKIKRLAMKFNIKLFPYKKYFCKSCLHSLKGKIRISRTHKTIECQNCRYKNKFKLKLS